MNADTGIPDELKLKFSEDVFADAGDSSSCIKKCTKRMVIDERAEVDYFGSPSSFPCPSVTEETLNRYGHTLCQ